MNAAAFRQHLASGQVAPLYLFEGEDLVAHQELTQGLLALVDEGLHAFNVQSFHASDATGNSARDQLIADLLVAARTLPMMAPRRVLILHGAERLLSPKKEKEEGAGVTAVGARGAPNAAKGRRRVLTPVEQLEEYFEAPEPHSTVAFLAAALDGNRRLVKALRRRAVVVDVDALGSPAEAVTWVQARLERDGLRIEPAAAARLLQTTGLRMARLRAETEKLALFAAGQTTITARDVGALLPPVDDEPEDFRLLLRAIDDGNAKLALRQIERQFDAGAVAVMVLGQIRAAAGRLRPDARARRAIDAVFETDLAIKSSGGEPRYLIERLVIGVCSK